MTNQEAKQKAIQEAYGEYFKEWEADINHKGELCTDLPIPLIMRQQLKLWSYSSRLHIPIPLKGIYDNNGWTRIEPDCSNLPETSGQYLWLRFNRKIQEQYFVSENEIDPATWEAQKTAFTNREFTHYRPVIEIPKPIY